MKFSVKFSVKFIANKLFGFALSCALALSLGITPVPTLAEPPPHAKAHGWRKKNDPNYRGYIGKTWERDYGVLGGRCNTDAVLTVAGGAVGGVIGARVGEGDAVAVIVGAAIGAIVGNRIGRQIDSTDQACVGHALELSPIGKAVRWSNAQTGVTYELTPLRDLGKGCREFRLNAQHAGKRESANRVACTQSAGRWELQPMK